MKEFAIIFKTEESIVTIKATNRIKAMEKFENMFPSAEVTAVNNDFIEDMSKCDIKP